MLDLPACPTCGATSGACVSSSGRMLINWHAPRHKALDAWRLERERQHDEATRPKGPVPIVMELRSTDGRVQRFYPGPKRRGWGARWR